jgi:hypothetical protein
LRANGLWPTSSVIEREQLLEQAKQDRSPEARHRFACDVWDGLEERGRSFAPALAVYLNARGINEVPTTARATMPPEYLTCDEDDEPVMASHDPGMVLPVRNKEGEFQGIQVTWLDGTMTAKRPSEAGPPRQCYGLVKGNFVQLDDIDWHSPPSTLLIGEGAETTLAAMQITGLHGIASAGASMMQHLDPPRCDRFIILADNGDAGQQAAAGLANRLLNLFPDCNVQIATPGRPEGGKTGYDWNDALIDAGIDHQQIDKLRCAILEAPPVEPTTVESTLVAPDQASPECHDAPRDQGRCKSELTQSGLLIELASDADLFHTDEGTAFATIQVNGHLETWPIKSNGFRQLLMHRYYIKTKGAPNREALTSALAALEARARFDAPTCQVHLRTAGHNGKIYLDLGDPAWRVVEIDTEGWRVVDRSPVRFTRAKGMLPLPIPVKGGTVHDLRKFINIRNDGDFTLVVAYILAALRPQGPYPILALRGEEGTGKSTLVRIIRSLVDPNKVPLRSLQREERDLYIAASNGHLLCYDNVSTLPSWLSDALCRLATGGGFAIRMNYTDQDEVLIDATRPALLNGIEDFVARADLADRCIFIHLAPITGDERRDEAELKAGFEAERPAILGALLDAVAHGLREWPRTRLREKPRMADFARWAAACEGAMFKPGDFEDAYGGNRQTAVADVIEADQVAVAVRAFMLRCEHGEWRGTAAELGGEA